MTLADLSGLSTIIVGLLSLAVAVAVYISSRRKDSAETIKTLIRTELIQPIDSISEIKARVQQIDERGTTGLGKVADRVSVLETKMDVFWRNVGVELARVLHSPNPARAHVDALLEAWIENRITPDERDELKRLLEYIRDYHQGDESDFPVYAGDQVAAAILLQTMGFVGAGKV